MLFLKIEQAVNSKIKDVTVFLSGAEIHRSGKVTLNAGVTELKLKSSPINGNSTGKLVMQCYYYFCKS